MRNIKYIIVLLLGCGFLQAQEYQTEEIERLAYNFFNNEPQYVLGNEAHPIKQISSIEAISRDSTNYMYIANTNASSGWVILANEKMYPTIIAHGDSGSFVYDEEELSPAILCILDNHMNAIDSVRNNNRMSSKTSSAVSSTYIFESPNLLRRDKWQQYCNNGNGTDPQKIYNKYVPHNHSHTCEDYCGKDPVGCGPIAMSKIMRYWQWPDHAYIGGTHNTTYYYDWEHMPTRIDDDSDMYLVDAIAHLFRSCGQAAVTAYTCSGSATVASQIHSAMSNEFNFHSRLVDDSDINVSSTLIDEIDQGRPIIVQAHKATIFQGHSFVVDGYRLYSDGSTKFHVHWGWGLDVGDNNQYWDLDFNGYKNGQKFLIELYPLCDTRNANVSLNEKITIRRNENRTYYSNNTVLICPNNNSITVDNGGHLLIKAGNRVYINNGFHAVEGSSVHVKIESPCDGSSRMHTSAPCRSASLTTTDDIIGTINYDTDIVHNVSLQRTSIYSICGQLIQNIEGEVSDMNNFPQGMYILQYHMSDGSIKSKKVRN